MGGQSELLVSDSLEMVWGWLEMIEGRLGKWQRGDVVSSEKGEGV